MGYIHPLIPLRAICWIRWIGYGFFGKGSFEFRGFWSGCLKNSVSMVLAGDWSLFQYGLQGSRGKIIELYVLMS